MFSSLKTIEYKCNTWKHCWATPCCNRLASASKIRLLVSPIHFHGIHKHTTLKLERGNVIFDSKYHETRDPLSDIIIKICRASQYSKKIQINKNEQIFPFGASYQSLGHMNLIIGFLLDPTSWVFPDDCLPNLIVDEYQQRKRKSSSKPSQPTKKNE